MSKSEYKHRFSFDRPGTYRIRVQGCLDKSWSERLGGMSIMTHDRGDNRPITTLDGLMRDQAELAGVLNTLYELHLTLLSVKFLNGD